MSERFWHLKCCDLFERLDAVELKRLESQCRKRIIPRKVPIYLPADAADAVLLLTAGRVKLCKLLPDGRQAIVALVEPGELFGELAVLSNETRTIRNEYAEAMESSTLVLIPRPVLMGLIERQPLVSLAITRLFGLRRQLVERRLTSLLFRGIRQRLACLILDLAEQYGTTETDGTRLRIRLSHQDLADLIGSTRETVTVLLGEFQRRELVVIGRQRLTLRDPHGMAREANENVGSIRPNPPRANNRKPAVEDRKQPQINGKVDDRRPASFRRE